MSDLKPHVLTACPEPLPAAAAASEPHLAAAMNACTLAASFATPSGPATPLDTSTIDGRVTEAASATFSGVSPPASIQPLLLRHCIVSTQSLLSSEEVRRKLLNKLMSKRQIILELPARAAEASVCQRNWGAPGLRSRWAQRMPVECLAAATLHAVHQQPIRSPAQ